MSYRITHVITGLAVGGAEKTLCALASRANASGLAVSVVSLGPEGSISRTLRAEGVDLHHLGLRNAATSPFRLRRLRQLLSRTRPDLIQGWMYHGNLAAYLGGRHLHVPILWNVRHSLHRDDLFKMTTRWAVRANAFLSDRTSGIVYNSEVSKTQHEQYGFSKRRSVLIPNGIDIEAFDRDVAARDVTRRHLGIDDSETVLIAVGRVHPIKGHEVLMDAFSRVLSARGNTRLVVVGRGADWAAEPFSDYAHQDELRSQVSLVEESDRIPDLLAAADIFVNASHSEGFPNAVAEAMTAGLPCVVTDVGDSSTLIDGCGTVVCPGDPEALSAAVIDLLRTNADERNRLGERARRRIEPHFSLDRISGLYDDLYRRVLSGTFGDAG